MKIVLVMDRLDEAARLLAGSLRARGHEVNALAAGAPEAHKFCAETRRTGFAKPDPALYYEAFQGADLIHLFAPSRFCAGAEKHARQMRIPCVAGFYAQTPPRGRRFYRRAYRKFYNRFDYIHCPGQPIADTLRANGYGGECRVVPGGDAAGMEEMYEAAIGLVRHRGYRRAWPKGLAGLLTPHPDNINIILEKSPPWQLALTQFFGSLAEAVMFPINKLFLGLKIKGRHHLRELDTGAVSVCNHVHPLDSTLWKGALIHRDTWIISLRHNFAMPMLGLWIRGFGAVGLGDTPQEQRRLNRALEARVAEGDIVHFFPEGMLLPYCKALRPFHMGAFALAVQTGRPILPMVICQRPRTGLWRFLKRKPLLTLCILKPEWPDPALPPRRARAELHERTRAAMEHCLEHGPPRRRFIFLSRGRRGQGSDDQEPA